MRAEEKHHARQARRGARAPVAALWLLLLLLAGAQAARADEVTIAGSTSGSFTNALAQNTGPTLMGLSYISAGFNVTTAGGNANLNAPGASPGGTNTNNLGSFFLEMPPENTLDDYTGSQFTLTITFTAPAAINGGQSGTYTATLTGLVIRQPNLQSYQVNVRFDNPVQTFSFTNADGSSGSFTLLVNDVLGITPNFARALTGTISNASQTPAAVPEPATIVLLGTGLAGAVAGARRRRRARAHP